MIQARSGGRPLQLELAEDDAEKDKLQGIDSRDKGKGKAKASKHLQPQPLKRSKAFHFPTRFDSDLRFFFQRRPITLVVTTMTSSSFPTATPPKSKLSVTLTVVTLI